MQNTIRKSTITSHIISISNANTKVWILSLSKIFIMTK